MNIKWVGLISYDSYSPDEQVQIRQEISKFNAYPVFLDSKIMEESLYYYDTIITFVFHNFVTYNYYKQFRNLDLSQEYEKMNRIFAMEVLSLYKKYPYATILFNDPYFLLVPKLLSETISPHMGYFFHSPFPSYDIYRVFSNAQRYLESLLCCDIVGFQVYEHARHFFSCCHRILGLEAESRPGGTIEIIYKGRDILIRVGHTGISIDYLEKLRNTEEFKREMLLFKKMAKNRLVISSVDKLTPLNGIKNKLAAYRDLLRNYPVHFGKVLLVQYCTPGAKWKYVESESIEIKKLVTEINKEFPTSIVYGEMRVSNEKRLALLTSSDILLVTSLRDGFCLLPFEFIVAKSGKFEQKHSYTSSIILSEFTGCATAMSSLCRINPYVISEITYSILNSIESPAAQNKLTSFQHDIEYIRKHDANNWIQSLVNDIKRGHNNNETTLYLGAIDNKILKAGRVFEYLLPAEIQRYCYKASNRVIFLDGEGTLIPVMSQLFRQTADIVSIEVKKILQRLCADERNNVYILSGKPKYLMEKWFGDIPKLGLAAEYGFHYRKNFENEWRIAPVEQNGTWREKVKKTFQWYKERTDESEIEIKDGSIVWIYKDADPELGNWQAQQLVNSLKVLLAEYPDIKAIHGRGFVEVKPEKLQKGQVAQTVLEHIQKRKGNIDFLLCLGDDISDEPMFQVVNSLYPITNKEEAECAAFTCTVVRRPSHARYYVNDYKDVLTLLESLIDTEEKMVDELNVPQEDMISMYSTPSIAPSCVSYR